MRITLSCCCGATIDCVLDEHWPCSYSPKVVLDFQERHADCRPPNLAPNDPTTRTGNPGTPVGRGQGRAEAPGQGAKTIRVSAPTKVNVRIIPANCVECGDAGDECIACGTKGAEE